MSEYKIKFEFPDIFNEAVTPVASRASETLIALWDMTFGYIDNYANKVKFKRSLDLESFKEQLIHDIKQIPNENIIEPKLSIMGPAIESSKYYYEEPELRSMFSKLISSSMNSAYRDIIRTSFTSIIKELEPIDASNLKILSSDKRQPIADIRYRNSINGNISPPIVTNVFFNNPDYNNQSLLSSSLINLERLGLIKIFKNEWISDEALYAPILNSSFYKSYSSENAIDLLRPKYDQCKLDKGYLELTTFGYDFIKVCL